MNDFCEIDQKILFICENNYSYFFNKSNVVGVGLGYKIKNGFKTKQKCIKILVEKKVDSKYLASCDLIPTFYKGILTDVYETGIITSSSFTQKIRPAIGGYSIGPDSRISLATGTLGCVVTDGTFNYILSCNHVIALENLAPIGTGITQPSIEDKGKRGRDVVANLYKYIPLKFKDQNRSPINYVDCAIGKIVVPSLVSTKLALLGSIKGISVPILEEYVEKVGRTTELTRGQISSIGSTLKVNLDSGLCIFKNQILATKMSDYGDSGSILLDSHNYALGLLMGSSNSNSFFNPIQAVLESLNVIISY